jgi:predicted RNA-binding Zn-ribbon protein involved in translation (DUF1610 family)
MKNSEYKCMCCGFEGTQEDFGITPKLNSTTVQQEFNTCPECGSIDILALVAEDDMSL